MPDLNTIFAPAVIAAIVSALVTWLVNYRKQSLDYITAERTAWRKRIKDAMADLVSSHGNHANTALALQKIKSELNPYGKLIEKDTITITGKFGRKGTQDNEEYFLKDSQLWTTIRNYERDLDSLELLQHLLAQLEYKLKYDWELSKSEVKINYKWLLCAVFFSIIGVLFLAIPQWSSIQSANKETIGKIVLLGLLVICVNLSIYYFYIRKQSLGLLCLGILLWLILYTIVVIFFVATYDTWYLFAIFSFFAALCLSVHAAFQSTVAKKREYIKHCKALISLHQVLDTATCTPTSDISTVDKT